MKDKLIKYKEYVVIIIMLVTGLGGMKGIKMCSDEAQEWVQIFTFSDKVQLQSIQENGIVGSIKDTTAKTIARMSRWNTLNIIGYSSGLIISYGNWAD